ncbi:hypothetical protein NW739_02415 [Mycoplasmopsis felis]|uniref:hypothetical protein n=1 Tax=Mycoplasmopsis felis TaxID=33923 RepID=UPI0021E0CA95|nr:hypothetical protein [Mycoplasmopsis felis]MCU9939633.1 hypothetical protein [Mycoplasmopsis felis]
MLCALLFSATGLGFHWNLIYLAKIGSKLILNVFTSILPYTSASPLVCFKVLLSNVPTSVGVDTFWCLTLS